MAAGFFEKLFKKTEVAAGGSAGTRMVVGLGNPGKEYDGTRHNIGFEVVDRLAERLGSGVKKKKFGALFGECAYKGGKVILLKPQQYMNRSGQVVATASGFYKLSLDEIIVVTDDMALETGRIRLRRKGSAGGHNGLGDIINKLGSDEVARLRIGIGDSSREAAKKYVLNRPAAKDRELLVEAAEKACKAIMCWVDDGIDTAMNKFNVSNGQ